MFKPSKNMFSENFLKHFMSEISASVCRRTSIFGLSKENRRQRDANSTTMMLIGNLKQNII